MTSFASKVFPIITTLPVILNQTTITFYFIDICLSRTCEMAHGYNSGFRNSQGFCNGMEEFRNCVLCKLIYVMYKYLRIVAGK